MAMCHTTAAVDMPSFTGDELRPASKALIHIDTKQKPLQALHQATAKTMHPHASRSLGYLSALQTGTSRHGHDNPHKNAIGPTQKQHHKVDDSKLT